MKKMISVDVGTGNIVGTEKIEGKYTHQKVKDMFFKVDPDSFMSGNAAGFGETMLKKAGAKFVKLNDTIYILGDDAFKFATMFHQECLRPMSKGVLNPMEPESMIMVSELIKGVVGEAKSDEDIIYYSVPADPIDADYNIIFHTNTIKKVLEGLNFKNIYKMNEGLAVVYSELENEQYTGVGISCGAGNCNVCYSFLGMPIFSFAISKCVDEDTLICTNLGFIKIKDIDKNIHKVFDYNGKECEILQKINNGKRNDMFCVEKYGTNINNVLTSDHKLLIKRGINWEWEETQNIKAGDIVGETIIEYCGKNKSFYFGNSTIKKFRYKNFSSPRCKNLGMFFGIFLGDGTCRVNEKNGQYYVKIAFNKKDSDLIEKYYNVIYSLFHNFPNTSIRIENHGKNSNVKNIVITNKIIANKMREFYDEFKQKILPISLSQIPNHMALGIIEGLIDSDGYEKKNGFAFENTSSQLIWVLRQLLGRFDINGKLYLRKARKDGHVNKKGVEIVGRKDIYVYSVGERFNYEKLKCMLSNYENNSIKTRSSIILESKIKKIYAINEEKTVYDISVKSETHSYSIPYMTVHNCGDWIDINAAKAINETNNVVQRIKESGIDLNNPKTKIENAIAIYYDSLIEYIIDQFNNLYTNTDPKKLPMIMDPVKIVISGGTSMAGGFIDKFSSTIKTKGFPIPVQKIELANDPFYAVGRGLCNAAIVKSEN